MNNYYDLDSFKDVYLEDSFVLEIQESDDEVIFIVEAVLTENHPLYTQPKVNEQYCYKKAKITFKDCKSINWGKKSIRPSTDAGGNIDYGNIDSFVFSSEQYELAGDWGDIKIYSPSLNLNWIE